MQVIIGGIIGLLIVFGVYSCGQFIFKINDEVRLCEIKCSPNIPMVKEHQCFCSNSWRKFESNRN